MKKLTLIMIPVLLLTASLFAAVKIHNNKEKEAIKEVIYDGYVIGMFKEVDLEKIGKHWHRDCDMVALKDGKINKRNMGELLKMAENTGNKPPAVPNVRHEIKLVDVTGYAAVAKVEIFFGEKHMFTDYFSLYKFENDWKIATKIWYEYPH